MKRKTAVFLALALLLASALPAFAAAPAEPTGSDGKYFFANGAAITISAEAPASGTLQTLDPSFTALGTDAYISWAEGTKYVGVTGEAWVFGGCDARTDADCDITDTSITMTGGEIYYLFGGSLGADGSCNDSVPDPAGGAVTGTATVDLGGGRLGCGLMAASMNSAVNNFVVNIGSGIDLSSAVVAAGICGNGTEGIKTDGVLTSNAVVNSAVITITDNPGLDSLFAGGSGYTGVEKVTINASGSTIGEYCASGLNGHVGEVDANFSGCAITGACGVLRGTTGSQETDFAAGTTVSKLETGVANNSYAADSAGSDISGITGSNTWNIDETSRVENVLITPARVEKAAEDTFVTADLGEQDINNGNPALMPAVIAEFTTNMVDPNQRISGFASSGEVSLDGVDAAIVGSWVINGDDFEIGVGSKLTVDENSLFVNQQGGTLENEGTIQNLGDIFNDGGSIQNLGNIDNRGTIDNRGSIENSGSIASTGSGCIENGGQISSGPGATVEGPVTGSAGVRAIIAKVNYNWTGSGDMVITEQSDFADFAGGKVLFDGVQLAAGQYTAEAGSVRVTIKESFLGTVANGGHILRLQFADGSYAETTVTVNVAAPAPAPSPAARPNPSTGVGFWGWLCGLFA